MEQQFKYLFTPLKIGSLTARNRIVLSAHGKGYAENHLPSERYAYYYAERAKGGVGLICQEGALTHMTSMAKSGYILGSDKRAIAGFKRIADAVHEHGVPIIGQIAHSGGNCTGTHSGLPVWAPSPVRSANFRETPHELEREEIAILRDSFVQVALNLQDAGYDGCEIHGGNGYLIQQFVSPLFNERTDEYGGSLENRLRFPLEVIDAVRAAVGSQFVVGYKMSGDELVPGGLTLEDMKVVAQKIEGTGKIDYIFVSQGNHMTYWAVIPPMDVPLAAFRNLAAGIRQVVDLPVFGVGRINDPILAEQILADGHADMIGMTRALIADPELPNKAREGRLDEIRQCVACVQACRMTVVGKDVSCVQNFAAGKEKDLGNHTVLPAAATRKILVIGGGPAGMEAARVAAMRGHRVILYEKAQELGGQVNIAARGPMRAEFGGITRYLGNQMRILGVEVHLGAEATARTVAEINPDAVVIATGSIPEKLPIPGADGDNVVNYWQALREEAPVGDRVLVVDAGDGFWPLCSTAEFLAAHGHKVEVITPSLFVGVDINILSLPFLYSRFREEEIILTPATKIKAVEGKVATLYDVYSKKERQIEVDTVVMAVGNKADDALYKELRSKVSDLHAIGDCCAPRRVDAAIREGNLLGRKL